MWESHAVRQENNLHGQTLCGEVMLCDKNNSHGQSL